MKRNLDRIAAPLLLAGAWSAGLVAAGNAGAVSPPHTAPTANTPGESGVSTGIPAAAIPSESTLRSGEMLVQLIDQTPRGVHYATSASAAKYVGCLRAKGIKVTRSGVAGRTSWIVTLNAPGTQSPTEFDAHWDGACASKLVYR